MAAFLCLSVMFIILVKGNLLAISMLLSLEFESTYVTSETSFILFNKIASNTLFNVNSSFHPSFRPIIINEIFFILFEQIILKRNYIRKSCNVLLFIYIYP